jgi:hypothetical protein
VEWVPLSDIPKENLLIPIYGKIEGLHVTITAVLDLTAVYIIIGDQTGRRRLINQKLVLVRREKIRYADEADKTDCNSI